MKNPKLDYVKIFTISVVIIVLVLSFLPINPYEYYSGEVEPETRKAIYITIYKPFYTIVINYSRDILLFVPFLMTLAFFVYYIGSLLAIIYLLFDKNKEFLIFLVVSTLCMIPYAATLSYVSIFALVTIIVYIVLIVINALNYRNTQLKTNSKLEAAERALNNNIAKNIRTRRKQLGFTQQTLAEKSYLSRTLISKIESAKVRITDEHLDKISKSLDTDIDSLKEKE